MGLDIYLYRFKNYKESMLREAEYERASEANWNKSGKAYDKLTDEEKEEISEENEALKGTMGLVGYGEDPGRETIELDSKKHVDHMFKIGYFRSSYNSAGMERILENLKIPGLYEIFDYNNETQDNEYGHFQPDWKQAQQRALDSLEKLKDVIDKGDDFTVQRVMLHKEGVVKNEQESIQRLIDEREKHKDGGFRSYSGKNGDFYLDGITVYAVIPAEGTFGPEVHLVVKGDEDDEDGGLKWYAEALEIVIETCDFVLASKDSENYYMSWSG